MKQFLKGKPFLPIVGKRYAIHYGTINLDGKQLYCSARIKVNGTRTADWEDLDTGKPLDPRVTTHAVQAFKEIGPDATLATHRDTPDALKQRQGFSN